MESVVLEYLGGFGDVGIWVAVYGLWRLERRITILEVQNA